MKRYLFVLLITLFFVSLHAVENPFSGKNVKIHSPYMTIQDALGREQSGNINRSIYIDFCSREISVIDEYDGAILEIIPYTNYRVKSDYIEGETCYFFTFYPKYIPGNELKEVGVMASKNTSSCAVFMFFTMDRQMTYFVDDIGTRVCY